MGKRVRTNHGDGVVIARQVLTQLLQIRTDSDEVISVAVEDILIGDAKPVPAVSTNDNGPRPPQSAPREGAPFGRDATRGRTRQEGRSTAAEQEPRTKAEISETTGPKEASSNLQGQEPRRKRRRRRGRRKRPQGDAGST